MFVMPTIPDSLGPGMVEGRVGQRQQRGARPPRSALPLAAPNSTFVMELPTGLEPQDTMLM